MKKILLLAFTISFIPLETQAEQKICMQLIMDVITMEEVGTMSNCLAGDIQNPRGGVRGVIPSKKDY